jgi:hypothetical protein
MACNRNVFLEERVYEVLGTFDLRLLLSGWTSAEINDATAYIMGVFYLRIAKGTLENEPQYLGVCGTYPNHSRYSFDEGPVKGVYSCNADQVIIQEIMLSFERAVNVEQAVA